MFSGKVVEQLELRISDMQKLYEARIVELNLQISDLKKLIYSPTSATDIPLVTLEADAIISQKDEVIEFNSEDISETDKMIREADRIFAGSYEEHYE